MGGKLSYVETVATLPDTARQQAESLSEGGKTPLFFAADGRFLGIIAVADVIKEDSAEAIKELTCMGIRVVMLTGDNDKTAQAIGRQAGITEIMADLLPDGKAEAIRSLRQKGRVAMVGDGINDAPALTEADIGIAIGAGTDVAIDAADVVLMQNRLSDVAAAVRLSRATLRNIRENLFWAFVYNIIGIPLAAGLFIAALGWEMNPMFGAAAMSLSSFCVVTNALRLNFVKLRPHLGGHKQTHSIPKENKPMTKTLHIDGMMCPHCEAHVKKALEALDGVTEAVASHKEGTAVVTLSADVSDAILKKTVEDQGYTVK
jgi:Cu2+-exporting ATPase